MGSAGICVSCYSSADHYSNSLWRRQRPLALHHVIERLARQILPQQIYPALLLKAIHGLGKKGKAQLLQKPVFLPQLGNHIAAFLQDRVHLGVAGILRHLLQAIGLRVLLVVGG